MVVQALLNRPFILRQQDTELYLLARDHFPVLRDWFNEQTGWSLLLTRQFAKLEKMPGEWQPWMVVGSFRDGRDYGFFTYGLWYLEGLGDGEQFLLSELVETIREHLVAVDVVVDWTLYDHRLSMARALKKLRDLAVLQAVEGDETDWARSGSDSDVLYESSPLARYVLQRLPRDLMSYRTLDELTSLESDEMVVSGGAYGVSPSGVAKSGMSEPDVGDPRLAAQAYDLVTSGSRPTVSDKAATRRRRHVMQRLLQEPVVYDWQWADEERRYVQTQRATLIERMRQFTGLEGRRFREGLLFVWPELTSEMTLFPTLAVLSDISLVLAGELRRKLTLDAYRYERDEQGCYLLTQSELEGLMMELRGRYGEWWSKEYREKPTAGLATDLVVHLQEWNLGWPDGVGGVRLFPALVRWNGDYQWEGGDEQ